MKGSLGLRILGFFVLVSPSFCLGEGLDTWQWRHPPPQGNSISGFTYGNGLFAAAAGRAIVTSPDATNWTTHPLPPIPDNVTGIAFGNGTFVAVGAAVVSSTDG